jgi:serine phosphatase RsbU (regulator of sigma subunit)
MVLSFLVAGQFEAIIHDHAKLRQVMADGEQAVVRAVQSRLDPNVVPEWDNLQLAVYCKGGSERVTDLYDVMRLPTGQACLLVARIESEGVQTALSMAGVRAAFRVAGLHCDPPHILLKELDWLMRSEQSTSKIACATACVNTKTGEVQYASAGTAGLYRVDGRGEPHQLADPDLPMVGSGKDSAYTTKTTELQSDESLAMFTPGFLTLSKGEDEPTLTEDQFVDTLCDGFGQSAQELIDEAVKELSPYLKKGHQPDDITLLAAHWMSATL